MTEIVVSLKYDPDSGSFTRERDVPKCRAGEEAGYISPHGYRLIQFDGKQRYAHHIAWKLMTGSYPDGHIDHINGKPSDNRWCNLRVATVAQNMCNSKRPRTNKTGVKGVTRKKGTRRFLATIVVDGKHRHLGYYDTIAQAAAVVNAARVELHGEFARAE